MHLPSVDADDLIYDGERLATPPLLTHFIDLIDLATLAFLDTWLRLDERVSREEALAALAEAERRCACTLLSERVARRFPCAYNAPWGGHCQAASCTPEIYGFLTTNPNPYKSPDYLECWPFFGRLCARHLGRLVIPPASWWPEGNVVREEEREAVLV